jgi:hypothetical protein
MALEIAELPQRCTIKNQGPCRDLGFHPAGIWRWHIILGFSSHILPIALQLRTWHLRTILNIIHQKEPSEYLKRFYWWDDHLTQENINACVWLTFRARYISAVPLALVHIILVRNQCHLLEICLFNYPYKVLTKNTGKTLISTYVALCH